MQSITNVAATFKFSSLHTNKQPLINIHRIDNLLIYSYCERQLIVISSLFCRLSSAVKDYKQKSIDLSQIIANASYHKASLNISDDGLNV